MLLPVISQQNYEKYFSDVQPEITWDAPLDGDYSPLSGTGQFFSFIWQPTTSGVATYNHHPFIIEFGGYIHAAFSTHPQDEEGPGQYVRYSRSADGGVTWTTPVTVLESQDDDTLSYLTDGGRVVVCAGFAVIDDELYVLGDVNDRDSVNENNPRLRIGVGIIIRKINMNETFDTTYWIENIDGTLTAPAEIPTYPVYTFNNALRIKVKEYFLKNPEARPDWYYSVPETDVLFTQIYNYLGTDTLVEPRIAKLPNEQYLKLWRVSGTYSEILVAQTSQYGHYWEAPYNTPIPNSPARIALISMKNGIIALVGNNESGLRDPLYISFSADGFSYNNDNTYNIDEHISGPSFGGFGKGAGVQYPNMIQLENGKIAVIYTVNKEDVKISIFNPPDFI